MRDERVLVAWRQQRAQQNEIGRTGVNLAYGLRSGVDHDELRTDALGKDRAQDSCLHLVRFDNEDSAHVTFSASA